LNTLTDSRTINGKVFQSVYDAATRTTTTTSPLARSMSSTVYANGNLSKMQVPGVTEVQLSYDTHGRVSTITQGTRSFAFAYHTTSGYLTSMTDPLSQEVLYVNDAMGRATQSTLPDTSTIGFEYDANGNLAGLTPPGKPKHEFEYNFADQLGLYRPPVANDINTRTTVYTYNRDRQLVSIDRPDGQSVGLVYDPDSGRLSTANLPAAASIIYTPDTATGHLQSVSGPYGETFTYARAGSLVTGREGGGLEQPARHICASCEARPEQVTREE
jgi:YD repeat-containing protein